MILISHVDKVLDYWELLNSVVLNWIFIMLIELFAFGPITQLSLLVTAHKKTKKEINETWFKTNLYVKHPGPTLSSTSTGNLILLQY